MAVEIEEVLEVRDAKAAFGVEEDVMGVNGMVVEVEEEVVRLRRFLR